MEIVYTVIPKEVWGLPQAFQEHYVDSICYRASGLSLGIYSHCNDIWIQWEDDEWKGGNISEVIVVEIFKTDAEG